MQSRSRDEIDDFLQKQSKAACLKSGKKWVSAHTRFEKDKKKNGDPYQKTWAVHRKPRSIRKDFDAQELTGYCRKPRSKSEGTPGNKYKHSQAFRDKQAAKRSVASGHLGLPVPRTLHEQEQDETLARFLSDFAD